MGAQDSPAAALSYAWWLTGDEETAAAAVRAASVRADASGAGDDEWLTALLREIRAAVGPAPTMCPASEVALLHDIHGLALDEAAALVAVDLADARTELAHGRLEALTETVIEPCVHPERLGGLAVGNPADVAHARQCSSCGRARELLDRGRVELRELAGVAALWDAGDVVAGEPADPAPVPDAAPPEPETRDPEPFDAPPEPETRDPEPFDSAPFDSERLDPAPWDWELLDPAPLGSDPLDNEPDDFAPSDFAPPDSLAPDPAPRGAPDTQRPLIFMSLAAVALLLFLLWLAGGI